MTTFPDRYAHQPEWLQASSRGCEKGWEWSVFIDGTQFAIVKSPGGYWSDNGGRHYGRTTWNLWNKTYKGFTLGSVVHEGRMNKTVKARLQKMVDKSDKAGTAIKVMYEME